MTREERATREALADRLAEQGYVTYSELFSLFDLNITYDPTTIGYMIPNKGTIVLNGTLKPQTMMLVIRHEILHEYLTHEKRLIDHVAKKHGLDPDDLDDVSLEDIKNEIYKDSNFNIAGDYEISNRGYTEQDKQDIKNIELNGQIVSGLVTEDEHPDWVDLPLEDMYDNLVDELNKQKDDIEQQAEKDKEQSGDSQSDDQGDGAQGQSSSGQGQQGNQPGEQKSDSKQSSDNGDQDSGDQQGGQESGDQQSDQQSDGQQSGQQSNQQSDDQQAGQQSNQGNGQQGDDKQSGQPSGDQKSGQRSDSNANSSTKSEPVKIVHGTFKNGHFYDVNGKEIIPGGK